MINMQAQAIAERRLRVPYRAGGIGILLTVLLLLFVRTASAQQDSPPTNTPDSSANSSDSTQDAGQEPVPDHPETSTLLQGGVSADQSGNRIVALRWGHLSAISVESFYAYDTNYRFSSTNPQPSNEFGTRLIAEYSIGSEHGGLDLQYRPYFIISDNNIQANFLGSLLDAHAFRRLSSRWTLNLHNLTEYAPDQSLFINPTISLNGSSGEISQQAFVANNGTQFRVIGSASLSYHFALHDTITFHGQITYVDLINNTNQPQSENTLYGTETTGGGGVTYTHSLGPNHEIGVSYNYDRQILGGPVGESHYQNIEANYRQKIRPTVLLQLSGGPSWRTEGNTSFNNNVTGSRATYVALAQIIKTFHQASLALLYTRSYDYIGIITNSYHDRYDALYARNFGRTWGFALGASYIQTHAGTFSQPLDGRTLFGRVSYYLSPQWTLFTSYENTALAGGPQPYASRNFIMVGAKWSYGDQRNILR
jgi:hypothetical protein